MTKFDDALSPPTPGTTGTSVVQSVQSSLYQRLRKPRGDRAGTLAWMLIRLTQTDHRDHGDAQASLMTADPATLQLFSSVVSASRATATRSEVKAMLDGIAAELSAAAYLATTRGGK